MKQLCMYRFVLSICSLFFALNTTGQHRIIIRVISLPEYHKKSDSIFLAGNFNNWNPADKKLAFESTNNVYQLEVSVPAGRYEYKLTRGSWSKVETESTGAGIQNRILQIQSDTLLELSVAGWSDHFPSAVKQNTITKNVTIIDTAFFIPQLNRHRRIWIYLPATYNSSKKKYPVMYMHDGQNVFDAATSYSGEWGVDEAMDSLSVTYGEMIIVAVDNGGEKRMNEYSPFDMQRFGKAEGDQYVDFLVKTLRPYIKNNYRTKSCRKYNHVAGSSMGGLISLYAMMKYPKKFGGAGVFSPAFWIVPELKKVIPNKSKKIKGKIYLFAGMQESDSMVPDMLSVFELLDKHSKAELISVIRAEGKHNENTWREEFPLFYKWLMRKKK